LNKTGDSVGNNLSNTVLNNLQLTADFAGLLILDNQPHEEIKQMNEAEWTKSTSKEEIFTQLCQDLRHIKEEMVKLTNIQNKKLDKLTNITQNLENKLNGMQKRWLSMKIS